MGKGHELIDVEDTLQWIVARWDDEVKHRPWYNHHRRTLDNTWRQIYRFVSGGEELPRTPHDEEPHASVVTERCENCAHVTVEHENGLTVFCSDIGDARFRTFYCAHFKVKEK